MFYIFCSWNLYLFLSIIWGFTWINLLLLALPHSPYNGLLFLVTIHGDNGQCMVYILADSWPFIWKKEPLRPPILNHFLVGFSMINQYKSSKFWGTTWKPHESSMVFNVTLLFCLVTVVAPENTSSPSPPSPARRSWAAIRGVCEKDIFARKVRGKPRIATGIR